MCYALYTTFQGRILQRFHIKWPQVELCNRLLHLLAREADSKYANVNLILFFCYKLWLYFKLTQEGIQVRGRGTFVQLRPITSWKKLLGRPRLILFTVYVWLKYRYLLVTFSITHILYLIFLLDKNHLESNFSKH